MIEGEREAAGALTEQAQRASSGSRMPVLEDASSLKLAAKQWLLKPHASPEPLRKRRLEPTRGDPTNPAKAAEGHVRAAAIDSGVVERCWFIPSEVTLSCVRSNSDR